MQYVQLDFASYSWKGDSLSKQAGRLLHELMKDRSHDFPCDCGACIYAEYRRNSKAEGRPFSKRTFFVFFLYWDFFTIVIYNKPLAGYSDKLYREKLKENFRLDAKARSNSSYHPAFEPLSPAAKIAHRRNLAGENRNKPWDLSTDIWSERVKHITRRRTLDMIKILAKEEKDRAARTFLRGILKAKNFYTYYACAANSNLGHIVGKIRRDLFEGRGRSKAGSLTRRTSGSWPRRTGRKGLGIN